MRPSARRGPRLLERIAAQIVTVNDAVVGSRRPDPASGLELLPLHEALQKHGDRLRELLVAPDTMLGGAKFAALNHAQLSDAVVLVVPPNTEISDPVEIVHWLAGENASTFPRTLVLAGDHARGRDG